MKKYLSVLILVLMEVGLGALFSFSFPIGKSRSLNPCFNGSRSRSNGINKLKNKHLKVLILVLMEVGLGVLEGKTKEGKKCFVLILVLMEVGLGEQPKKLLNTLLKSLNPCFNGSRSRRKKNLKIQN